MDKQHKITILGTIINGESYQNYPSPNGKTLATGTANGTVQLWHAATDKDVKKYLGMKIK